MERYKKESSIRKRTLTDHRELKQERQNECRYTWTMLIKRKAIIFCATQDHAAVRDLVNQTKKSTNTNYCVRVTANDGEIGDNF
jgi:type I site-specific restriction endonuclease